MIRVMRLWRDGMATPVYTGISVANALRWAEPLNDDGRLWIEDERKPAVALGSDWKRQ